ncbi:MAG: hypothetical protein J4469_03075 [Candidatus Aenigmarchaeota archaeon]|nr:hypothetical protein [Candidatus Aenigmarchaeota archaeon]
MLKDINDIKDTYNKIRQIENKLHKVKTLHSLGKLDVKETKDQLRLLESELKILVNYLPETEKHYYFYKRLYGHPVKPAGKVH